MAAVRSAPGHPPCGNAPQIRHPRERGDPARGVSISPGMGAQVMGRIANGRDRLAFVPTEFRTPHASKASDPADGRRSKCEARIRKGPVKRHSRPHWPFALPGRTVWPMHRRLLLLAPLAAFISACAGRGSNDAGQQVPATPPSPAIVDASASGASPAAATAGATSTSRADFTVVHWIHAKT